MVKVGDCFRAIYPKWEHLHIIVSDVTDKSVAVVFVSSIKKEREHDPACELMVCEHLHPYITKDSYIVYDKIIHFEKDELNKKLQMGEYIREPDASPELIKRIIDGAKKSEYISEADRKFFFHL